MSHYNKDYFDWQKNSGALGGDVEQFKFSSFIKKGDNVIDFGCGGGYILGNLQCLGKFGIEPNSNAREVCKQNGVPCVANADEIPDLWADVIISNHALEHCFQPLDEVKKLFPKLRHGGKIIFVTPLEKNNSWKPNDINQHLYTWSEMNLGNIFTLAGFKVLEVQELKHRWPPYSITIRKWIGTTGFHLLSRIWARMSSEISQVRLVAEK
ncbi:MAG: class I SAM-dependent methyltransferase [Saprospiraceae bacterium]